MTKPEVRTALNHDVDEVWRFLEQRDVLRILEDGKTIRLLLRTGTMIDTTQKGLEILLIEDRAQLREEIRKASGRKAFIGYRTTYNNYGGGQIVQTSDPKPHFEIVGRNKKRLDDLYKEWDALTAWRIDIQKVFNFVVGGELDIPARFLPDKQPKQPEVSNENRLIADSFVSVCERERTTHPSLQQLKDQTGIPIQTISRKLKAVETLSLIRKLVLKKINYTKNNQDRKNFWLSVEAETNEMVESLAEKRKSQREKPSDRLGEFAADDDESR